MHKMSRRDWNRWTEVRVRDAKQKEREGTLHRDPYLKKILESERARERSLRRNYDK